MAGGIACGRVRTNEGVYGDELIWRPFIRSRLPTVYRRLCCNKFASHRRLVWPDSHSNPSLHTAAEPAVRSAVKILVS